MSEFITHVLALLMRVAADRLSKGGQFVTRETLVHEIKELVYEGLRSEFLLRLVDREAAKHASVSSSTDS